jgi:hypothetical protein
MHISYMLSIALHKGLEHPQFWYPLVIPCLEYSLFVYVCGTEV